MVEKLSACIVVYRNYGEALGAIESILTHVDSMQLYIVDNSAPDTSEALQNAASFKKRLEAYSRVEYLNAEGNLGFGKGHNLVLPRLSSRFHAIVNPDVILTDDAFTPVISFLEGHPSVGMVIPRIVDADGQLLSVYRKELTPFDMFIRMFCSWAFPKRIQDHTLQDMDYSRPFPVPFGQGSFLVIRTELFKRLGGFDENYFMYLEDADLCKRVNQSSSVMYFPGASVVHKWKRGSHRDIHLFMHHLRSMKYYFAKWGR